MKVGLHALGIGAGAHRDVIDQVAVAAELCGFATLWSGEHVVMVDQPGSRYPYSDDGRIAVPSEADWIDPMIGLSFAAAATSSIGIGTGVLLLPEHNPVLIAKQAATLDTLSGGRFTLGVGIGWSREEFDARPVAGTAFHAHDIEWSPRGMQFRRKSIRGDPAHRQAQQRGQPAQSGGEVER